MARPRITLRVEVQGIPGKSHRLELFPLVKETSDGRRDWTRTNDPHHVKVVL